MDKRRLIRVLMGRLLAAILCVAALAQTKEAADE